MLYSSALKKIIIFALVAVLLLPVFAVFFVVPRFQVFFTVETQRQTEHVAAHLAKYLSDNIPDPRNIRRDSRVISEISAIRESFDIMKVNIFSLDGRLLYSSDPDDQAKGDLKLFSRTVKSGRVASQMVEKKAAAGRISVVETYAPILMQGRLVGISEIYKDVTPSMEAIDRIAVIANFSAFIVGLVLMFVLAFVARQVMSGIGEKERLMRDRREMETALAEKNRNDSIATLTAGISHDFNNILTAVLAHLNIARMQVAPGSDIYKSLDEADKSALIARDLTRQLMAISRVAPVVTCAVDTRRLLEQSVPMAHNKARVAVDMDLAPDLMSVMVDRELMIQALQAVIVNGDQVSPEGKPVRVRVENVEVGRGDEELPPGRYVRISISDAGPGIPEKYIERIFDPYFTTRERDSSRGVGLGLAFCKSVIDKHQGLITVDSVLDRGTTFHINLPVCEKSGRGK